MFRSFYLLFIVVGLTSCATYYQRNVEFNHRFQEGNLDLANKALDGDKKAETRKTRLLFYLNKGVVSCMKGDYAISNQFFEQAYVYTEDYAKNRFNQVAAIVTNPNAQDYYPEDHEALYINYYKALNYFGLQDFDAALVECKRMNIRLGQQDDKYKNEDRFKKDAFIHLLMGVIYESKLDYNNAFIAYRNSYDIYISDYAKFFGMSVPEQLKTDLMHACYMMGFHSDLKKYEADFGVKYTPDLKQGGDLVFLWHNGLGPVKSEWSINFSVIGGGSGNVTFVNEDLGFNFPILQSNPSASAALSSLKFLRIAFPKYISRPVVYNSAQLSVDGVKKKLDLVENVDALAIKSLKDRALREFSNSLLRVAVKKAAEQVVRDQNEGLGMLVGVMNAVTEKADTRHWATLPNQIHYTRLRLEEGQHKVVLNMDGGRKDTKEFDVTIQKNRTVLKTYHSLEFIPISSSLLY